MKVLVHQAGAILGYDKVDPYPSTQVTPLDVEVARTPAPPAAPEPSQKRAGERFGPIELPESVKQKYDTRPLGTLPLLSEPDPTRCVERSAPAVQEPLTTRVLAPRRKQRPIMLGAALAGSVVVATWGVVALMQSTQDETWAPLAHPASPPAGAEPLAPEANATREFARPATRVAPPVATEETPEQPATAASATIQLGQSRERPAQQRATRYAAPRATAPEVETKSQPSRPEATSASQPPPKAAPLPKAAPQSREAEDLMLGQW